MFYFFFQKLHSFAFKRYNCQIFQPVCGWAVLKKVCVCVGGRDDVWEQVFVKQEFSLQGKEGQS